jgi:hypothetical protein
MSSRLFLFVTVACAVSASGAYAKQSLTPSDLAHPGLIGQLKPPLCTGYQIHHIGFGGHWIELDDGSVWSVDDQDGWRLSYYTDGQRVVLLRDGDWLAPRFELVFGSQTEGIPVYPHSGPETDAFRYRSIVKWSQDGSKLKLSDGSWWCADVTGIEAESFRQLKPDSPVMLTCRKRWWSSQAAVALLDTTTWYSYAVRSAAPDRSVETRVPEREGIATDAKHPGAEEEADLPSPAT